MGAEASHPYRMRTILGGAQMHSPRVRTDGKPSAMKTMRR